MTDKINLQRAHRYVQSIFLSALIAHENDGYICDAVDRYYPLVKYREVVRVNHTATLLIDTTTERIMAHNGTDGTLHDWANNFKANTNELFHDGISDEYFKDISPTVCEFAKGCKVPIRQYGHSQGDSDAVLSVYDIRGMGSYDVEAIGSCGPEVMTQNGKKVMSALGCRVTKMRMKYDLASKVGGIQIVKKFPFLNFCTDYGKIVDLPPTKFDPVIAHAWSHVMDSQKLLFEKWKMPEQIEYINAVRHVCKI
jgi:hypothetical protein